MFCKSKKILFITVALLLINFQTSLAFLSEQAGDTPSSEVKGFWKTSDFDFKIVGMDIGDVNGDGQNELIVIDSQRVLIYQWDGSDFAHLWGQEKKLFKNYLTVDVSDINKNGRAEIFVTNMVSGYLKSFVLEYEDNSFQKLQKNIPLFLRVLTLPEKGENLFGQKYYYPNPFSEDIYQYIWRENSYIRASKLNLSQVDFIDAFAAAEIDGHGQEEIIKLDEEDCLCIYAKNGQRKYKSDEHYGRYNLFVEKDSKKISSGSGDEPKKITIKGRVLVKDLNDDGRNELILINNISSAGYIFKNYRDYKKAEIVILQWENEGFAEKWRSKKMEGYIIDYQIGDFNNDGVQEIGVAVNYKVDLFKYKSRILFFEIQNSK